MTSKPSPQGRRILVAVVTGEAGDRIQAWRRRNDPEQADRLPPHTTLCYWAPTVDPWLLEHQVKHAFLEPITLHLGNVREFDNDQHTFYVPVDGIEALNEARTRLYDGRFVALPPLEEWTWHITCVRDSRDRDLEALRVAAAELPLDCPWRVDTVSYLELIGGRYEEVATWSI